MALTGFAVSPAVADGTLPHRAHLRLGEHCAVQALGSGSPTESEASATFTLRRAERSEIIDYTTEMNLVFCRATNKTLWWIRFAQSTSDDGSNSPHLDVDLCNAQGAATFSPMNPRGQPCPGGLTWGIWWHDGDGQAFANRPDSAPCELALIVENTELRGTFVCHGLVTENGEESIDILDGSFRFELPPQGVQP